MGEIADMMLDGTMCAGCGVWLHDGEDGEGYPGYCDSCSGDFEEKHKPKTTGLFPDRLARSMAKVAADSAVIQAQTLLEKQFPGFKFGKSFKHKARARLRDSIEASIKTFLETK